MTNQLAFPLESPFAGRARRTDPEPSHAAAKQVNATAQVQRIHRFLASSLWGFTRGEIAQGTGIRSDQVSSRLKVMEDAGLVRRDGFKECPETHRNVTRWCWNQPSAMVNVRTGEYL